ncbi:hypothetical protein L204_101325 [Cryptococcus depauperatus]|nr:hypothetical protein L204_03995 [Cryptococcus depauperatus CBS 7855]
MFKNKVPSLPTETDYTGNLCEASSYRYGHLRSLGLTGEVTSLAVDPILSLFAIGTGNGFVHCYGGPPFQFTLPVSLPSSSSPARAIKFLFFHPGHHRLIAIDDANTISTYSLQHMTDHPNPFSHPSLPTKEIAYTLWGMVTSVEQPLPSHTHLFLTIKDGTTLAWDLSRRRLSSWRVGNMWLEFEKRLVRSGIPGRQTTMGGPMATCLAMNPRDLNIMLIGYEGGVVAWNMQRGMVDKTFEMTLPPGSAGGGSYQNADGSLWTERRPSVTCISWRPDGLIFAVGHADGCITFWAYSESDKPLMVRTISHEDVNVIDAESLLDAGALANQYRRTERDQNGNEVTPAVFANREPIFKLSWVSFPDQSSLQSLVATQNTLNQGEPMSNATMDYAERGETLLLILGGQSPKEKPGINLLQLPAYKPAIAHKASSSFENMSVQERSTFRDSLAPTGSFNWLTRTPPEDFILIPRASPYFNLCHDPISIIISLTPDHDLPKITEPYAARSVEAWVFPPPRCSVVPLSSGRRNLLQAGHESVVPMTPALIASPTPLSPQTGSSWKLPWSRTSSPPLGAPAPSTPDPTISTSLKRTSKMRRQLATPSSIWTGNLSILGVKIYALATPIFKSLISWTIEHAGEDIAPRLPVKGGMAVPDLQSHGAPKLIAAKMESYRILVTSHADLTVRFWDISSHILILPTPLRFEYPNPLPHLTIDVADYLIHPDLAHLPLARLYFNDRSKVCIKSVHLAREALECVITFGTGEVIVTKFRKAISPKDTDECRDSDDPGEKEEYVEQERSYSLQQRQENRVEEVLEIGHLAKTRTDGFKPVVIFTMKQGEPICCEVSDIGFISVAFSNNSVAIIDMRGPDVVLREGFDEEGMVMKTKKKKGNTQHVLSENSLVGSMKWVVSGMGSDLRNQPRLIISYAKGMTKIYSLINVLGEWMVELKPLAFMSDSLAEPLASFVLDPMTGVELTTSAEALEAAMSKETSEFGRGKELRVHCIWVAASKKTIRTVTNYNGERLGKVELDDDELSDVFYVMRHGHKVIVATTSTGKALFYSVPYLHFITCVDLFVGNLRRNMGRLSIDDRSGDFIEYCGPLDINLRTFFRFHKPFPPRIDPCAYKKVVPPQPQPLTAGLISWIWGSVLTGAQLDALVAGPTRPSLPDTPPPPPKPLITWGKPPEEPVSPVQTVAAVAVKRIAVQKQKTPLRDSREREDVYTEMTSAGYMRGDMLDSLGNQLNNASVSAAQYLNQAKNAALKESAKASVKSTFGKLL